MAFLKYAAAVVEKPSIGLGDWNQYQQRVASLGGVSQFGRRSASKGLGEYSPDKYLLTHCTIMASVDVEDTGEITGESVKTAEGAEINRPHSEYLVTPETSKYINGNGDCWERQLLLNTYTTFIGAENYVEHVQIPELSKGKVIDAIARDLGDTVYIDILVATDRKHEELIAKIEAGKLNTLSMGCTIAYSICTKCGNLAEDEADLCRHIKYEKGNKFIGPDGKIRVIAELCGHHSDPESVQFIEASWVDNPAFKGAVMRNILDAESPGQEEVETKIEAAFTHPKALEEWTDYIVKTATQHVMEHRRAFGYGDEGEDSSEPPGDPLSAIEGLTDEIKNEVYNRVLHDLRQELNPEEEKTVNPEAEIYPNDTIHESSYRRFASRYSQALKGRTRRVFAVTQIMRNPTYFQTHKSRFSNADIIAALYLRDREKGIEASREKYTCLLKQGALGGHRSATAYVRACERFLGRRLSRKDALFLIKRAQVLN